MMGQLGTVLGDFLTLQNPRVPVSHTYPYQHSVLTLQPHSGGWGGGECACVYVRVYSFCKESLEDNHFSYPTL